MLETNPVIYNTNSNIKREISNPKIEDNQDDKNLKKTLKINKH